MCALEITSGWKGGGKHLPWPWVSLCLPPSHPIYVVNALHLPPKYRCFQLLERVNKGDLLKQGLNIHFSVSFNCF